MTTEPNEHEYTKEQADEHVSAVQAELKKLMEKHGTWTTVTAFHLLTLDSEELCRIGSAVITMLELGRTQACQCEKCRAKRGQA